MKKLASLIVAATAALACGQSFALAPTATPELTVTLSGASAQDVGLRALIESVCAAGTLDYFSDTGVVKVGNFNAYSCSVPVASLTTVALKNRDLAANGGNENGTLEVLVYKRSEGGSGQGPIGLCTTDLTKTKQVAVDATCSDSEVTGGQVAGDKRWKCAGTVQKFSDGSLTDLEYKKVDSATCATTSVVTDAIWGTIFNTPVSLNFRNALQCAQGLVVGSELEADMPNLPKEVIASAFNNGLASWNSLQAKDSAGNYTTLPLAVASKVAAGQCPGYDAAAFPVPASALTSRVVACKRVVTSGTNTQFRVKFLNALCTTDAQDIAGKNTAAVNNLNNVANWTNIGTGTATGAMIETSGSGNMGSCLSAFADGADTTKQRWAIGIQSLENNVNLAEAYRFIKIDGAAPTIKNVLEHKYYDWVESQWAWINPTSAGRTQEQKDAVDFQVFLNKGTGEAAAVGTLVNSTFIHSFGASGIVALNTIPGNVPSLPINPANPVATSSHAVGGNLSSCRTPQVKAVNTAF